ncbi:hypothetical protein DXN05_10665 [Deminuibacter soli]|uniref:DUF2264 domain-containing protein n=2 Tax=Deminuibacter soli TaxID=2291815 RepID=A0A3E1NJ83_9BACT|nr:hypothetical protein DXN05_10665 [Deminuibacter soli]
MVFSIPGVIFDEQVFSDMAIQHRSGIGIIVLLLLSGWYNTLCASDSLQVHQLLNRIAAQQVRTSGKFAAGMFPSYREYDKHRNHFKDDDNAFYTGLVVFTLRQLRPHLPPADQLLCDTIISRAAPVYARFRNTKGRNTYNFWQTDPPTVFPNGGWLNWMNKTHTLPDDMDDTAIVLMAMDAPDSVVQQVHALMQGYTNNGKKKVKNTLKAYKHIAAYSTWFGKRMPIDFDVCVLSNVLYMVQQRQLAFTAADSASLQLIQEVVKSREYMLHPSFVAPHYSRSSIILYHLSRLMQLRTLPLLEPYKQQLIADAQLIFAQSDNLVDKIILSTALMRWGVQPPVTAMQTDVPVTALVENSDFVFFIANMTSMLPNPFKQWMGSTGLGRFFYYAPAYNNVLLLEYLVWRKRVNSE